jgi:hypothetical protein
MAELKTKATAVDPADFLDAVPDPARREDGKAVAALMARVTGKPAAMWGPSIVGYGSYDYTYDSGRTGTMCRIGFSPRKAELVLYVLDGNSDQSEQLGRLGKHKTGKGCLYIKKLADVDMAVLEELVRDKLARMDAAYPT